MNILFTIAAVLVALWLAGFVMHIAGGLIHILLFVAVAMFIYGLIRGRASV